MPSSPATATYIFGFMSLISGVVLLLDPMLSPPLQQLPLACQEACMPISRATAMAATAMGIYYPLLAWQENRAFFIATVPVRLLSSAVFIQGGPGWGVVSVWEGCGACATGAALLWEYARGRNTPQAKKSK
jgi:hypothetical protein